MRSINDHLCDVCTSYNHFGNTDSSIADEAKYSSVVRVKPSHCQYDLIGEPATSNDHSSNEQDHEDHVEPVVYAKVNRHRRTTDKIAAEKTEGNHNSYSIIFNIFVIR